MNRVFCFALVFLFINISHTQSMDAVNNGLLEIYTAGLAENSVGEIFVGIFFQPKTNVS